MAEDTELDAFDMKIVRALSQDGRMTLAALSEIVGLSKTPCQARIRRLEKDGYILGYQAIVSPVKLGLEHVAFAEVKLSDTRAKALDEFNTLVELAKVRPGELWESLARENQRDLANKLDYREYLKR